MRTIEWEMPYWNWSHRWDYAELAYLMLPRPFMVERGHLDLVGRDQWVAHEYAKVRFLYAQLGLADRTEIEFFQGAHSINGDGTFAFLSQAPALADARHAVGDDRPHRPGLVLSTLAASDDHRAQPGKPHWGLAAVRGGRPHSSGLLDQRTTDGPGRHRERTSTSRDAIGSTPLP
jgi:hypothetical protein